MQCINLSFESYDQLERALGAADWGQGEQVWVQVFCGRSEKAPLQKLLSWLKNRLPQAVITGASTAGEILGGTMQEKSIVLSLARFEKTRLTPLFAPACDAAAGQSIGRRLLDKEIKGALLFTEGLIGQPEAFLHGIATMRPDLIVCGGAAADNGRFKKTWIFLGDEIFERGAIGVAFNNPDLVITTHARLNYLPLGKAMTVTAAEGNRLITLDNRPVRETIGHYLGQHTLNDLPASIVHFPLLKERDETVVARAPVAAPEDGSLIYAGNFKTGESVRFGMADSEALLDLAHEEPVPEDGPVEALWIYSCMGRKAFLGKSLEAEFGALGQGRPLSGFFTYGEFFHSDHANNMLNLTTTVFALSEGGQAPKNAPDAPQSTQTHGPLKTLSHLVDTITAELEEAVGFLEGYRLANDKISLISRTTPDGLITYVNEAFCAATGYAETELIGQNHRILRHPDVPAALFEKMWQTLLEGQIWRGQLPSKTKSGATYYVEMAIVPIKDAQGHIKEFIAVRHDITRLVTQEKTLAEQMTDSLTRLPNRNAFFNRLPQIKSPIAALLNVDRFRDINSFYGFKAGDQLLKELAAHLQRQTRQHFEIYRTGGDLFLVLGENIEPSNFENAIRKLLSQVSETRFLEQSFGVSVRLTAGIAAGEWQILSRAEAALNRAQERRTELAVSQEDDDKTTQTNLKMIALLKQAVSQPWWVVPFFQPIAKVPDGTIVKYEALMRLRDGEGKIYTPFSFLELAKHSRYYADLTKAMIQSVLAQFNQRPEGVTLNLSVEDIQNPQTMALLKEAIARFSDPARITLEVTETEMIEDYQSVIAMIDDVKKLGVKIAIDDFGSGYSNFAYLIRFQADYIKIDGSIVREIAANENAYQTLCAIVDFAKRMGMETIAEFISSEEIALKAKEAGVDYWQGYYIAEPAPL